VINQTLAIAAAEGWSYNQIGRCNPISRSILHPMHNEGRIQRGDSNGNQCESRKNQFSDHTPTQIRKDLGDNLQYEEPGENII